MDNTKFHEQYENALKSLGSISFYQIRATAVKLLFGNFSEPERNGLWEGLRRGTKVLDKEEELWEYLYAFGNMHEKKMRVVLGKLDLKAATSKGRMHIVDWGCGQGLATVCLLDYLRDKRIEPTISKVTLIEPSKLALRNAALHVGCYGSFKTDCVQKLLDDVVDEDIADDAETTIHLFSNIIDVSGIDLKRLTNLIARNAKGEHYLVCVSPHNAGSRRLEGFKNYFKQIEQYQYEKGIFDTVDVLASEKRERKGQEGFTMDLLLFKYVAGKSQVVQIDYYPPAQFFAGYELDFIGKRRKASSKADEEFSCRMAAFDIAAPFDLGASVYDGIHPITAVLSNMVSRGLPAKASPLVEDAFSPFANKRIPDNLGRIAYDSALSSNKAIVDAQFYTPIGVAWVQKAVLEAVISGRLSLDLEAWDVLVRENDVPCAALAFVDLKEMFSHLVAMTNDYQSLSFPKVNLSVIASSDYQDCPLHLDAHVVSEPDREMRSRVYDMVIEVAVNKPLSEVKRDFSDFSCKNDCYFAIGHADEVRSERYIYTTDLIVYRPLGTISDAGVFSEDEERMQHLRYFLNVLFRKESFRPGQAPILNRALQGKNVIGLLPTGGGKSLTYQISALLQPGVTVVIDPLKSLMKDQYEGLRSSGIDACTFINSSISKVERRKREQMLASSQTQFMFMSPERLCIYEFRTKLELMHEVGVYFAYGVIDEVHCVSEWGHDFRFSYLHLGRNLYNYVRPKNGPLTLFGLTATASFDVLADVERELSGEGAYELDSNTIVRYENADRLELQYRIRRVPIRYEPDPNYNKYGKVDKRLPSAKRIDTKVAQNQKKKYLRDVLLDIPKDINELQTPEGISKIKERFEQRQNAKVSDVGLHLEVEVPDDMFAPEKEYKQAGIIFCPHRANTGISVAENADALKEIVRDVGTFVGSSDDDDDSDAISFGNLDLFKEDKQPLMVATKAFGMGIDKPNIRFTLNMNYSSSLEGFVQEAGRAGRDRGFAVANVLVSDYRLVMIDPNYTSNEFPLKFLKGKWFEEADLRKILAQYGLNVPFVVATPNDDFVKLKCSKSNKKFAFRECEGQCSDWQTCHLAKATEDMRGWIAEEDLEAKIERSGLQISRENIVYLNPDYQCNMFFYGNNFKGVNSEKRALYKTFCNTPTPVLSEGDDPEAPSRTVPNLIEVVLELSAGEEMVAFVSYDPAGKVDEKNKTKKQIKQQEEEFSAEVHKAIYRMCCIGFIDDFTQDYAKKRFRVVIERKKDGDYYKALKQFLMRYYVEVRAEELVSKVPEYKGDNEVQKCLGYLTEFIYEKIAVKRKRAIDDIRTFCSQGMDDSRDWTDVNEDLKDFIYYYFNSKYARDDYKTDEGEDFSLTVDTDRGKICNSNHVLKYMRVVDDDLVGGSGTPIDNVKHLQGAVRLVRRSLTDSNPTLALLNAFCLMQLGVNDNEGLERQLVHDYQLGLIELTGRLSPKDYWSFFDKFHRELKRRPGMYDAERLAELKEETIAKIHLTRLREVREGFLGGLDIRSNKHE